MLSGLTLKELANATNGRLLGSDGAFLSVSTDTRTIQESSVFFALVGENFDGHDFVSAAIDKGACCVVVSKKLDLNVSQCLVDDTTQALGNLASFIRQRWSKPITAITGSCGKTTVKGMVQAIFSTIGNTLATTGNLNNHIGVPLTLFQLSEDHDFAVIEVGASAVGEIDYLSKLTQPNVALINNVQPSHVEGFGSVDAIAQAKSEIYDHLADSGIAIINSDDKYAAQWLEQNKHRKTIRFSTKNTECEVFGKNLSINDQGYYRFDLVTPSAEKTLVLKVLGESNVMNALAAASCGVASGFSIDSIVEGLESFLPVPGRLVVKPGIKCSTVIDDTYNANPGSVKAAIDVLSNYSTKTILVLGDMGELGHDSAKMHKEVGQFAQQKGIHSLFACGELSKFTCDGFGDSTHYFNDKNSLVTSLLTQLDANTTVLVKGSRSAKMEDVVNQLVLGGTV